MAPLARPFPSSCPAPAPSGVRLRSPAIVVGVGFTDEIAAACRRTLADEDVGFVRVSQGIAACRVILDVRPTLVAIGPSLWSDEIRAIATAAAQVNAQVVEVPRSTPNGAVGPLLAREVERR